MPLTIVLLCAFLYIALLFFIAWRVDHRADRGRSIVQNPYIYSLSLAVYCTAWTFFGSVGKASSSGLSFLAIYLGPTLIAPLWISVLYRMILVSKNQRLSSIADFISARYNKSAPLATVVTLIAVFGTIPYISIQLKAVTQGIDVLTGQVYPYFRSDAAFFYDASLWVAVAMVVFTILFGTRKLDPNERHEGLVAAIAFESIVKLIAFFGIGMLVTFVLFNGFGDLFQKAFEHSSTRNLFSLGSSGNSSTYWISLLFLSASAILFLPRQFHIAVVENTNVKHLTKAMWMFPLYLLLINIFVLPIALAGKMMLNSAVSPDTYVLTLPLAKGYGIIALLAFIGGLSAATGMVVVSTTSLSIMISNHLVVPILIRAGQNESTPSGDGAQRLLNIRRFSIFITLLLAYIYLKAVGSDYDLVSVGLISFIAVAQFAPAALGGMYWKRGTHQGAISGLVVGFLVWAYTLPLPSIADAGFIPNQFEQEGLFGLHWLRPGALFGLEGLDGISHATLWSVLLNTFTYILVSLNTQPSMLTLLQADVFINIARKNQELDRDPIKREAALADLRMVLNRFLNETRVERLFHEYELWSQRSLDGLRMAPASLINYAETQLSGAIGSASARLVINSIATEAPITLQEMMEVLDQTKDVLEYSRALEAKSAELEATTASLQAANKQLKNLDRLKADFITTVTHELRTPVTSIKALSKIILDYRDELSPEKTNDYLKILVDESERISRLINQVLDIEKIQNESVLSAPFQEIDLEDILETTVRGMEQLFFEKGVKCLLTTPKASTNVMGNRDRLIQVFVNLLSNALKFAPNETGEVKAVLTTDATFATISVEDNGLGIDSEFQKHIFEKFTQFSQRETGKPHGSGLGLFISKSIVEQHDGEITVHSQAGKGAKFIVRLKLISK